MAFMKRDVNLGLLILIIFSIFLFSGFSVYYQTTFKDISLEYQQKLKQLGKVTEDLGAKKQELNETYKLRTKVEEDKRILDERYKDVRDENTDLHSELAGTKVKLVEKRAELDAAEKNLVLTETRLSVAKSRIVTKDSEIASKNSKINNLNEEIDCLKTEADKVDADENTGSC